jgi:Domain of unknown function (DUF6532)
MEYTEDVGKMVCADCWAISVLILCSKFGKAAQSVRGQLKTDARLIVIGAYRILPNDKVVGTKARKAWTANAVKVLLKDYAFLYGKITIVSYSWSRDPHTTDGI